MTRCIKAGVTIPFSQTPASMRLACPITALRPPSCKTGDRHVRRARQGKILLRARNNRGTRTLTWHAGYQGRAYGRGDLYTADLYTRGRAHLRVRKGVLERKAGPPLDDSPVRLEGELRTVELGYDGAALDTIRQAVRNLQHRCAARVARQRDHLPGPMQGALETRRARRGKPSPGGHR
eukprot:2692061-Pyramimonas_sp.AAC.1